jgi:hypothetical protein
MKQLRLWAAAFVAAAGLLRMDSTASAAPQKVFAMANGFSNAAGEVPNNPSDTIMFYDVTDIGQPGATGIFNNSPLFSVWAGYEIFEGEVGDQPNGMPRGNREEISALAFNPANGTVYVASFDSGTPVGSLDPVGDSQGDFDFYRIDYQKLLDDYVSNNRPRGTIYAPAIMRIPLADEQFLESISSPLFDGTADGVAHDVPHPTATTTTISIDGAFTKIGEVGRPQTPFNFFDEQIDFINPETFVFLDGATTTDAQATSSPAGDFQIRGWQRVSSAPGAASINHNGPDGVTGPPGNPNTYDDEQGGYNGNTTQSWKSTILGRLQMDALDRSEPSGWAFVRRDGKLGVWAADNEGAGGEQVSYFELDFSGATPTATKKVLPTTADGSLSFRVDENPTADGTTNDGEIDFLAVDKDGNLVIGESGFFDTIAGSTTPPLGSNGLTAQQPRVFNVGIESYSDAAGVLPEGYTASSGAVTFDSTAPWTVSASIPEPAADDDNQVINTTRVAYDRGTGYIYIVEQDADFFEDIYVFDPVGGTLVYSEINALNPSLFNAGTQIILNRGDIDGNGVVNQADVTALQAGIADPTLGGTVSAAVGAEWYDLTGDGLLNNDDFLELTTNILDVAPIPGDFDSDGTVDAADLQVWKDGYGTLFDGNDFLDWQQNLGAGAVASAGAAVPEPAAALLAVFALGAIVVPARRRRH